MKRHWKLNRRTMLRALGVTLALPYLECMAADPSPLRPSAGLAPPKRFCATYFPYGVSLPAENSPQAAWHWSPREAGNKYTFTESNKSLDPHRHKITFLSGLSHMNGRKMGGHDTADVFLTGAHVSASNAINTISLDQVVDQHYGNKTRYGSLILSGDGGVGEPTRTRTLSYTSEGRPIPSYNKPAYIFSHLFGEDKEQKENESQQLLLSSQIIDRVLAQSKSMRNQLGVADQRIFDQYVDSVDATGKRVVRAQEWLKTAKPNVDKNSFKLDAEIGEAADYVRVMYDLMAYALQTDSVRAATYMMGQMAASLSATNNLPSAVGLRNWHGLAHDVGKGNGYEALGKFDQFLTSEFANFIKTLDSMKEGNGTVLDNTIALYGSSNSKTHNNSNYPILIAGGKALGMRHGQHHKLDEKIPLANVYVTILNRLGIERETFADSNGNLNDIL